MKTSREKGYESALQEAKRALQTLDPYKAAYMAGCDFHAHGEGGQFIVPFFGRDYVVTVPRTAVHAPDGQEPDTAARLIILHYLIHADGTPPADHWIAFRELPNGLVYDSAFHKRAGLRLAAEYGADARAFAAAAGAMNGERLAFGDASYMFRALPRIRLAVILHVGDEEFGPRVNLLFDAAAGHYLPIEDLAVLGGMLASRLIQTGTD